MDLRLPVVLTGTETRDESFCRILSFCLRVVHGLRVHACSCLKRVHTSAGPLTCYRKKFCNKRLGPGRGVNGVLGPVATSFKVATLGRLRRLCGNGSVTRSKRFTLSILGCVGEGMGRFGRGSNCLCTVCKAPTRDLYKLRIRRFHGVCNVIGKISSHPCMDGDFRYRIARSMAPVRGRSLRKHF